MRTFSVPDMSCGHCKAAVESALAGVDSGATVAVDLETRKVSVETAADDAAILAALKDAGYDAAPA